jgi:hypothetical protein
MFAKNRLIFLKFLGVFWLIIGFGGCFSPEKEPSQNSLQITNNSAPDSSEIPAPEMINWEKLAPGDTITEKILFATLLELFPDSFPAHQAIPERLPVYRTADNFMTGESELRLFYPRWDTCAYLWVIAETIPTKHQYNYLYLFKKTNFLHWKLMYVYSLDGNPPINLKNKLLKIYNKDSYSNDIKYTNFYSIHRIEKDTIIANVINIYNSDMFKFIRESWENEPDKHKNIHRDFKKLTRNYIGSTFTYTTKGSDTIFYNRNYVIGLMLKIDKPLKYKFHVLERPNNKTRSKTDDFFLELINISIQETKIWDKKKLQYITISIKAKNVDFPKHFLKNLSSYTLEYHRLKKKYPKIAQQIYARANKAQKAGLDAWLLTYENAN